MNHAPDPHGYAAMLLCESLMITLIRNGILRQAEALEAIADVLDVKREIARSTDGVLVSIASIGLLRGVERSLAAIALADEPSRRHCGSGPDDPLGLGQLLGGIGRAAAKGGSPGSAHPPLQGSSEGGPMLSGNQDRGDIIQISTGFADRSAEPLEVALNTLGSISACEDQAIFVMTTPQRAAEEAAASAGRYKAGSPLGLLDGIPVAWKDVFDLQGEVTRAGSVVLKEVSAERDAALVRRLTEAGAVTVGKLNLTEFAYSVLGLNPHFGTPKNAWSAGAPRVPGGSSSGCGVAVALGLVPAAVGTDTSGSVRVPAAFNGIIGFKPSGGRWPLEGCFPLSETLDTAGVLCRTVLDAVIVDAAARGLASPAIDANSLAGLRVIVPTNVVWDSVEPAVLENSEAALQRLTVAGACIERQPVPVLDALLALNERCGTLVAVEAFRLHVCRLANDVARMDRQVAARLTAGGRIGASAEAEIRAARPLFIEELNGLFDGNTLLAFPTVPHTAPLSAELEEDDALFAATNKATMRNTMFANFLDWCSISIPTGFDAKGLPTALLLSGGPRRDDHLLACALAAEPLVRGREANSTIPNVARPAS